MTDQQQVRRIINEANLDASLRQQYTTSLGPSHNISLSCAPSSSTTHLGTYWTVARRCALMACVLMACLLTSGNEGLPVVCIVITDCYRSAWGCGTINADRSCRVGMLTRALHAIFI